LLTLVTNGQIKTPPTWNSTPTIHDRLLPVLPPLRNRFGPVVAAKESGGAYMGEGLLLGDALGDNIVPVLLEKDLGTATTDDRALPPPFPVSLWIAVLPFGWRRLDSGSVILVARKVVSF
jgi:hypothetical protein